MTFLLALFLSASPAQADVCFNPFSGDRPSTKSECWEIYARKSHKCVGACVADCEQFETTCNTLPDQEAQAVDYATYDYGGTEAEHYYGGHGEYPDTGDHGGEAVALPSLKEQILKTWTGKVQDGEPVGYGAFSTYMQAGLCDDADCMNPDWKIVSEECYLGTWKPEWDFKGEHWYGPHNSEDVNHASWRGCDPLNVPVAFTPRIGEFQLGVNTCVPEDCSESSFIYDQLLTLHDGIGHSFKKIELWDAKGPGSTVTYERRCTERYETEWMEEDSACDLEGFKSIFTEDEWKAAGTQMVTRELPLLTKQEEAKADADLNEETKKEKKKKGATADDSCMGCSTGRAASFGWWGLFGLTMLLARRRA
jgi:MYXO-CTERM domain-containing protein